MGSQYPRNFNMDARAPKHPRSRRLLVYGLLYILYWEQQDVPNLSLPLDKSKLQQKNKTAF